MIAAEDVCLRRPSEVGPRWMSRAFCASGVVGFISPYRRCLGVGSVVRSFGDGFDSARSPEVPEPQQGVQVQPYTDMAVRLVVDPAQLAEIRQLVAEAVRAGVADGLAGSGDAVRVVPAEGT